MARDDLFTNIHKAIRLGLFDLVTTTGSTDWDDPDSVATLAEAWASMVALLEAHSRHEDRHILRVLDPHDVEATAAVGAAHRHLDSWLGEIGSWMDDVVATPDPVVGLAVYRELALFTGEYLAHLHDEETRVMGRVWELCTDEEIAATRAAFMADMTPEIAAISTRLMLPAVDPATRAELVARLGVGAGTAAGNGAAW